MHTCQRKNAGILSESQSASKPVTDVQVHLVQSENEARALLKALTAGEDKILHVLTCKHQLTLDSIIPSQLQSHSSTSMFTYTIATELISRALKLAEIATAKSDKCHPEPSCDVSAPSGTSTQHLESPESIGFDAPPEPIAAAQVLPLKMKLSLSQLQQHLLDWQSIKLSTQRYGTQPHIQHMCNMALDQILAAQPELEYPRTFLAFHAITQVASKARKVAFPEVETKKPGNSAVPSLWFTPLAASNMKSWIKYTCSAYSKAEEKKKREELLEKWKLYRRQRRAELKELK